MFMCFRLKDGKEIEIVARIRVCSRPSTDAKTQTHQLIIDSVVEEDSGKYSCVVFNESGEEISCATLEVVGKNPFKTCYRNGLRDYFLVQSQICLWALQRPFLI